MEDGWSFRSHWAVQVPSAGLNVLVVGLTPASGRRCCPPDESCAWRMGGLSALTRQAPSAGLNALVVGLTPDSGRWRCPPYDSCASLCRVHSVLCSCRVLNVLTDGTHSEVAGRAVAHQPVHRSAMYTAYCAAAACERFDRWGSLRVAGTAVTHHPYRGHRSAVCIAWCRAV